MSERERRCRVATGYIFHELLRWCVVLSISCHKGEASIAAVPCCHCYRYYNVAGEACVVTRFHIYHSRRAHVTTIQYCCIAAGGEDMVARTIEQHMVRREICNCVLRRFFTVVVHPYVLCSVSVVHAGPTGCSIRFGSPCGAHRGAANLMYQ